MFKFEDLRIDTFRPATGNVNTGGTAVRITHIPTGTVVVSDTEKSTYANQERALQLLREKLDDTRTALHKFLDEWDGSIQCGCDHGCNQWLARNAAKMRYIVMELLIGNKDTAEKAAGMDAQGLAQDLHNKTIELARRERKKPLEQQEHSLWSRILKKG